MGISDVALFGLTKAQRMAEEDQNTKLMYKGTVGGPTPFYMNCPLDAVEDVTRGLRNGEIRFLLARHIVTVGGDEWHLDGDLELWRKAKVYATQLWWQGFLSRKYGQGELVYQNRKEAKMTNREKALELLDSIMGREPEGSGPSNTEVLGYAIVLLLADIGRWLEDIEQVLELLPNEQSTLSG